MKLKQEFVLRNVAGDNILIPISSKDDSFKGIITLNETGAFIWNHIENEDEESDIIKALMDEYEVTEEKAASDVKNLCDKLKTLGIL